MAGEESLLLKVRAESMPALEHLVWEIRALDSVERTKTMIVLGTAFEGRPVVPATPAINQSERSAASSASGSSPYTTEPSRPCIVPASQHRVQDRLLGGLDHGVEQGVDVRVTEHGHRHGVRPLVDCGRESAVAGGEAEHQVAAGVLADAAGARDAERGPLGEPVALAGKQRRVGGDEHDDRARLGRQGDRRAWQRDRVQPLTHRHAVHAQPLAAAVVGLHQHADRVPARRPRPAPRDDVPMPPLKPWQTMPVPEPTLPSATGPATPRRGRRGRARRARGSR